MSSELKNIFKYYGVHKNCVADIHAHLMAAVSLAIGATMKIEATKRTGRYMNLGIRTPKADEHGSISNMLVEINADGRIELYSEWYQEDEVANADKQRTLIYFQPDEPPPSIAARILSAMQDDEGPIGSAILEFMENGKFDTGPSNAG